jgi:hypothetical protein
MPRLFTAIIAFVVGIQTSQVGAIRRRALCSSRATGKLSRVTGLT